MKRIALLTLSFFLLGGNAMAFRIESPAFSAEGGPASGGQANQIIPGKYTCDGENISPPLVWSEVPEGTRSFALIVDDPDASAGNWVHWVIYDLPGGGREMPEGVSKEETLPDGTKQGMTDFRSVGYGGPCPPPGPAHRYFFKLYALDIPSLKLSSQATKADLLIAMNGHVLAQANIVGLYQRS